MPLPTRDGKATGTGSGKVGWSSRQPHSTSQGRQRRVIGACCARWRRRTLTKSAAGTSDFALSSRHLPFRRGGRRRRRHNVCLVDGSRMARPIRSTYRGGQSAVAPRVGFELRATACLYLSPRQPSATPCHAVANHCRLEPKCDAGDTMVKA